MVLYKFLFTYVADDTAAGTAASACGVVAPSGGDGSHGGALQLEANRLQFSYKCT